MTTGVTDIEWLDAAVCQQANAITTLQDRLATMTAELIAARKALAPFAEARRLAEISGRPPHEFVSADDYAVARAALGSSHEGETRRRHYPDSAYAREGR